MIHLDLFSGIGGFAYAADQVFGDMEHIFCDYDKFCQAVLRKHWPESEIYDDIRKIQEWRVDKPVTLLTGGFPCQPFSAAGLRRGTADDRHLWPEMLRVIRLTAPEWVIAENVGGLITWNEGLVLEQVCADLEAAGYTVQPFIIPAVAVNAPHRRDRIWFVAHAVGSPDGGGAGKDGCASDAQRLQERDEVGQPGEPGEVRDADNSFQSGLEGHGDTDQRSQGRQEPDRSGIQAGWSRDWPEIATELCSLDDGLPAELGGLKLSKSQHRQEQLKAYGNAIVPQVAIEIMKAIKETP